MKKALSTILGILAVMAMEFLLLIMLVDPDWFCNVMVIIGVILLGLLFATVLVGTGYVFGRDIERTKADSYIESLREKQSKEMNQLNAEWNAKIRTEIARLDAQHEAEIAQMQVRYSAEKAQLASLHSTEMTRLNDRIAELEAEAI